MNSHRSQSEYRLLPDDEHNNVRDPVCARCQEPISGKCSSRWNSITKFLLIFGLCQVPVLLLGFLALPRFQSKPQGTMGSEDSSGYLALKKYSSIKSPYNIVDAADASPEADEFGTNLKNDDGIVAVDSQWARQRNLPHTVSHPHKPDLQVYQLNVFHSLHCLYRIRNRLISKIPLEKWPRNDIHTMHCVDHLRNDLMCNIDVSLSGSAGFVSFNVHGHDRQCRDMTAVQKWALEHSWPGYKSFLEDVVGYDADEAERVNMAVAGQGKWNKANSTHDKETGKIDVWFEET
ncbi:uncharacterized protein CTRU02_202407 [Colletotrichum truncatum]|uniref:Uncharacterized protein n=1 Tax=Colletotrichum truncatum TaxID=5467 RepID=A0ACC3ZKD0_COLTU|nr:uncharacterized protein CTRU02_01569 [Colletotrichum truncatum]KAF6799890.1 hypothetical protein CTRU02_01569 [Colletotrichum truncatum]